LQMEKVYLFIYIERFGGIDTPFHLKKHCWDKLQ
jgi:hypothetical protein